VPAWQAREHSHVILPAARYRYSKTRCALSNDPAIAVRSARRMHVTTYGMQVGMRRCRRDARRRPGFRRSLISRISRSTEPSLSGRLSPCPEPTGPAGQSHLSRSRRTR
jgi:hypothetical protein